MLKYPYNNIKGDETMKKVPSIILQITLSICILLFLGSLVLVYFLSEEFAKSSPEIAYMQYPILILCWLIILGIIVALCLGVYLIQRSRKDNIFEKTTTTVLNMIGHCFGIGFLSSVGIYVYSYLCIGREVGLIGVYILATILVTFTAAIVFYFIASLFDKAIEYKIENEMTV